MKLSRETIEVLQNFASINQSMLFLEGNRQRTISQLKVVYAESNIEESFPKEFAIYDMSMFLGILSLFKEPELEFSDTTITFQEGAQKATLRYCNPSLIISPPKDKNPDVGEIKVAFELSAENLKLIMKAVSLYGHETIAFTADGDGIFVRTLKVDDIGADGLSYRIGDSDQKFKYVLKVENLKLMPHSYDVQISKSKAVVFTSKDKDLRYVIPCDAKHSGEE